MNWCELDVWLSDKVDPEIRAVFHEIGQGMHDLEERVKQIENTLRTLKPAIDSLGTNVANVIEWIGTQPDCLNRELD